VDKYKPMCCRCGVRKGRPERCQLCGHYHKACCVEFTERRMAEHERIMERVRNSRAKVVPLLASILSAPVGFHR